MIEIQFRTDEMSGREALLVSEVVATGENYGALTLVVEFIHSRLVVDVEYADLWRLPVTELYRLFRRACDIASQATATAIDELRVELGTVPVTAKPDDDPDDKLLDVGDELLH